MSLHTPTLMVCMILLTATFALSLAVVARRTQRDGLFLWGLALCTHTAGYVLFLARGQISPWASVVLANMLLSATLALMMEAMYQFQRRQPPRRWIWWPVALVGLAFSALLEHTNARVLLSALVLSLQSLQLAWVMWQRWHSTPGRGKWFVLAALALITVALLVRAVANATGILTLQSVVENHPLQSMVFISVMVFNVLANFGMVVMVKESADARNETLALTDELTGLHNRRHIQHTLHQQLAQAQRSGQPLGLLLLDVDWFKRINDAHGHLSGDRVLRELAAHLRAQLRTQDIIGRWGGEEFMALLPGTSQAQAQQLAQRLRQSIERVRFHSHDGQALPVTVSIGVHSSQCRPQESAEQLVREADAALYRAKELGRNRVECAQASPHPGTAACTA